MSEEPWYEQPRRWLQLNLVPEDAQRADVAEWQHFWRDAGVDGLTISAAGLAAYYPTEVPLHPRASERDLFGELCLAAKELGIRVLARFEASLVEPALARAHPDWLTDRPGSPSTPGGDYAAAAFASMRDGGWKAPCPNGPYFRSFMPEVMRELAERYPIDGFYANGWPYLGGGPAGPASACSCPSCLADWSARGHDRYPTAVDPDDPLWNDFVRFQQERYESVQRAWQAHVKDIRPGLSFVCNLHGSLASAVRWDEWRGLVDVFANDSQSRRGLEPDHPGAAERALWSVGRSAGLVHALADGRPLFHIVGAWHAGSPTLRRVAKEPLELRLLLAQVVARGAHPWCNVAGSVVHDRRWMATVRDYYRWHASAQDDLVDRRSLADVGIVWTPAALWSTWADRERRPDGPSLALAVDGWHETLLRRRQPFAFVPDIDLRDRPLDRFRALIVPSGSVLDPRAASGLARYAESGGGVVVGCGAVATELLETLGLGEVPTIAGPAPNAYLDIAATRDHELLAGAGDTDYLPGGSWTAVPQQLAGATGAGRPQPPLPFLADLSSVREPPREAPVLTARDRAVYLGTDLDAAHGAHLIPDTRLLLGNALDVALGDDAPFCTVDGPGIVDVNVWGQAKGWTVHLVNLTNPSLYGGPVDELVGVGPQVLRVRTEQVRRARLLRARTELDVTHHGDGSSEVVVPHIDDFEVVALDRETP